jgi:hypothetical protein
VIVTRKDIIVFQLGASLLLNAYSGAIILGDLVILNYTQPTVSRSVLK